MPKIIHLLSVVYNQCERLIYFYKHVTTLSGKEWRKIVAARKISTVDEDREKVVREIFFFLCNFERNCTAADLNTLFAQCRIMQ